MDINFKFMSSDMHFRCTFLPHIAIVAKQIYQFDVWKKIVDLKLNDTVQQVFNIP